jgi:2'-5' RNA ligase
MARARLFVSFETPEPARKALCEVRERLKNAHADAKWETNDKLHCTLKFLGDTDEHLIPSVSSTLQSLTLPASPFEVHYAGLGCFPNKTDPRIIWAGLTNADGRLQSLSSAIETAMAGLGFEMEKRAFHPHVTLGRVKSRKNLHNLLATMESVTFECQPEVITAIALMKSELRPAGSVYTTLMSFPLTAER